MRVSLNINVALLGAIALAAGAARADRRSFVRSYEYATQPAGNLEVEIWNDLDAPRGAFNSSLLTQRIELEVGITDSWDVSLYHVFQQGGLDAASAGFHLDSWRSESRYRLAEKGEWPLDVMLYLELERPADLSAPFELEEKVILEKDLGRFALVANVVGEEALHGGPGAHRQWEIDLGARYEVAPALRLAAEIWTIQSTGESRSWFAGPSLSVAARKIWIQLGVGVELSGAAQALALRSVLGFNL